MMVALWEEDLGQLLRNELGDADYGIYSDRDFLFYVAMRIDGIPTYSGSANAISDCFH